jgi:branched-chain amino acid transport system substrate-binding protein
MSADRRVGQVLGGRYRIETLIGQGGMSAVYKARDLNLQRVVALKLIHPHLSDNEDFIRRFTSEATAIALLRHPNIVEAYDLNHEGEQYYMVLEYIEGETLQARIKKANAGGHHLPVRDTLSYFIDICRAAGYAHQRGMIHRDIKPANIMLDVNGSAILMDFGIARILGGQQHTATGVVLGTALYMSPEQIQGLHPDARSDIYSLGVTLFEALGGRPPFEADSAMTLMRMHLYDPVPDLSQLHPGIPEQVRAIVNRALEKAPAERFQSCAEMAAALELALDSLPAEERAAPLIQPPGEPTPAPETMPEAPATVAASVTVVETPLPEEESASEELPVAEEEPVVAEEPEPEEELPPQEGPVSEEEPVPTETEPAPVSPPAQPPWTRLRRKWFLWVAAVALLAALGGGAFFLFRPPGSPVASPTREPSGGVIAVATSEENISPESTVRAPQPEPTVVPREELVIAILVPLENPLGEMVLSGVRMAIDEWNERGGLLEKQIVPLVLNSQCEPDPAAAAATQAIDQEKVHYIIGEVCTDASLVVAEIANARGVVMISPSATHPGVTLAENNEAKPYVFRACITDPFQGVVAAKFAVENLGGKNAFILVNPDDPYRLGLAEAFAATFTQMGGAIAGEGIYTLDSDIGDVLMQILESRPDLIYLPADYAVVNRIIRQAREMGIDQPFLGSDAWNSPELDKAAAAGSFFVDDFSVDDPRPEVQRFVEAFGARYKNEDGLPRIPDGLAALGYDTANLLLQGILQTGMDDPARVKEVLAGIEFQGVTGRLTFDPQHNPIKSAVIMAVREENIVFETVINP